MKKEIKTLKEEVIEWVNSWGDRESAIPTRKVKEFIKRDREIVHLFTIGEIDEFEMIDRRDNLVGDKLKWKVKEKEK